MNGWQRPVSRRALLGWGAGLAGTGMLGVTGVPGRAGALTPTPPPPLPFVPSYPSQDGHLAVRTIARVSRVRLPGVPHVVQTYTYDGRIPGATWEVRPGDTLQVTVQNSLPKLPPAPVPDIDRPHHWTTTNLHTHGLHVSPSGYADNIFTVIDPTQHFTYVYDIPQDHPAGLFWYHPHHHGAVCQQVRAGMAGLIVVRGDIDEVPEVAAAKEQVMVLQAIELSKDFTLLDPIPYPSKTEAFYPRDQIIYTVNGGYQPTVTMYPGEVQRWRLVNAAEGKYLSLALKGHDSTCWPGTA